MLVGLALAASQTAVKSDSWLTFTEFLAALGIVGAIINFFYTRSSTKRIRISEAAANIFASRIQSPAESKMIELEAVVGSIKAALLGQDLEIVRSTIAALQRDGYQPAIRPLENIFARNCTSSQTAIIKCAALVSDADNAVAAGFDKVSNPISSRERVEQGANEAIEAITGLCAKLRGALDGEIFRLRGA